MNTRCQILIYSTEAGYLFHVAGRASLRESPAVRDFVQGAMDDGAEVVMDLSECEHVDSTFLGCIVMLQQQSESADGSFAVYAEQHVRRALFGTSHLDLVLHFASQLPELLGNPVPLEATGLEGKELCEHLVATHRKLAELGGPSAKTFQRIVERLLQEMEQLPP